MSLTPREVTSGTTDTPTSSDSDKIVRISSTTGDMVVTLDTEANQSWNNEIFYVERATVNTVSISPASGVTMFLPDGSTITNGTVLTIPFQNGVIYLKHQGTGTDDWTVGGDIGSILGVPAVETGTTLTVGSEHIDALVRCSNTSAITVTFAVDADIPIGASGEIVQWGNGALSLTGSAVVLVSLDGDLTLSGLYASVVWTKIDATTYLIRGALAVEPVGMVLGDANAVIHPVSGSGGVMRNGSVLAAVSQSLIAAIPFIVTADCVVSAAKMHCATAGAGSTVKLGYYPADPTTLEPTSGLVELGAFDTSTTGYKEITGLSLPLSRGMHYFSLIWDNVGSAPSAYGSSSGGTNDPLRGYNPGDNVARQVPYYYTATTDGSFDASPSWVAPVDFSGPNPKMVNLAILFA